MVNTKNWWLKSKPYISAVGADQLESQHIMCVCINSYYRYRICIHFVSEIYIVSISSDCYVFPDGRIRAYCTDLSFRFKSSVLRVLQQQTGNRIISLYHCHKASFRVRLSKEKELSASLGRRHLRYSRPPSLLLSQPCRLSNIVHLSSEYWWFSL